MFNSHSGPVWPINLSIVVMFRVRDHTVRPRSRMSPKSTSEFSTVRTNKWLSSRRNAYIERFRDRSWRQQYRRESGQSEEE
ncbi:hypothetical protein KC320_g200 [Hortaea werneckii]|nr:hypothetical protein KC320_g200 [Hortaea werneckii]